MSRLSSTGSSARAGSRLRAMDRLHLDAFSGIAGNMFLAALLDLGLPRRVLEADLEPLGVPHRLVLRKVKRGALTARYLDVQVPVPGKKTRMRSAGAAHGAAPGHAHGRSHQDIARQIAKAKLVPEVRDRALAIFEALGRAEARVHGTKLENVHFHEVGAADALIDVVGACIGLHRLGIRSVSASPVGLGHGTVLTAHGRLPLPAPATLELLAGIPTVPAHVEWETVTPTGAAILRTVVDSFGPLPAMTIVAIGHGAGRERPGPLPNLLRVVGGRQDATSGDRVVVLETNLDDQNPEHFEYLMERLFEAGALDVSLQHLQMKKNRPGFGVRVLGRPSDRVALSQILFAESTAIGVRVCEWDRIVLPREIRRVKTRFGQIRVKVIGGDEGPRAVSPEYDDCKRAARRHQAPIREVVRAAEDAAREALGLD